jgi:hypothetical protein
VFPATVSLVINGTNFVAGNYQLAVQGTSGSITHSFAVPFNVGDYLITGPLALSSAPGGQATANLTLTSANSYSGQVNATCDATALPSSQCTLSPPNPVTIGIGAVVSVSASINIPNNANPGTYNIKINTQDTAGAPTHALTMALTVSQDFTLSSLTPSTQTILPGQSASYNFSVLPAGASFTDSVSLSCSGGPTISLCSFTPSQVIPGSSSAAVVLTISTTSSSANLTTPARRRNAVFYALWLALPGLCLIGARRKSRSKFGWLASLLGLGLLASLLAACGGGAGSGGGSGGGGGGGGGGQQQGTQPGTYTITVTGTSGTLSHQAPSTVTLIVNP